jgi:ribosome-dependent ATPase
MSIAIFISVFIKSQQAAIMASMMIFLFSGFFLSGLLMPFSLMGPLIKMEAMLMPTTHFVIISRDIFTKGAGIMELRAYILALLGIGLIFFTLTVLMFKKKL